MLGACCSQNMKGGQCDKGIISYICVGWEVNRHAAWLALCQIWLFQIGQSWTWPDLETQIWPEPDLGRTFQSQNNTLDKTNGVSNAVSCCKEAVQFSASFVMSVTSLFASFWQNLWSGFCIFFIRVTQIKIANTKYGRSSALVLSAINWTYCSCTENSCKSV